MIRLYDTMAREKREFVPADPKRITMYVCGPTVYGRAHIGNARPAVVFDTLARLIRHHYGAASLIYARNVTDVDDKIITSAADEGVETGVITKRFEQFYLEDMRALGVRDPDIAPHATEEIAPMIAMIGELVSKGHAYAAEGHVLFSVASDPEYGALGRRDRDAMIAGARVEVAPYKRDAADFVLWKPSDEDVIGWNSPWGRGRPGWHIECSAMIAAHLGDTIDIHGGGLDLIFPHHENETAQSRCAHGKPLANYWLHNGFLDMGAEKMSKSLGNVITVDRLLAERHRGETLRLALLSGHYRSPLPWTESLVAQSKATMDKFVRRFGEAAHSSSPDRSLWEDVTPDTEAVKALNDDLNTPKFISELHRLAENATGEFSESERRHSALKLAATAELIGLDLADAWSASLKDVVSEVERDNIEQRMQERAAAKASRDFVTADRIRDELKIGGILLEDGPGGTTWRRA